MLFFTVWKYKLFQYQELKMPPLVLSEGENIQFILGSGRFKRGARNIALFWSTLLLAFSGLIIYGLLSNLLSDGAIQIEINENLVTLSRDTFWKHFWAIAFLSFFPLLGIALLIFALKIRFTPKRQIFLTNLHFIILEKGRSRKYAWSDFEPETVTFTSFGKNGGTAILPLKKESAILILEKVRLPNMVFQYLDRKIRGSTDLKIYHAYQKKLKASSSGHWKRKFLEGMMRLLVPVAVFTGILLFALIPFLFVTIFHLKDDGNILFRVMEIGAILVVAGFGIAALWDLLKIIRTEKRGSIRSHLFQVLSFRIDLLLICFALIFALFYTWLIAYQPSLEGFFDYVFIYFLTIPFFFGSLFLLALLLSFLHKYIRPLLVLREFGDKGIAGNWSNALSPSEHELRSRKDVYLHQVNNIFSIKPIYAYFDQRLDQEGFLDEDIQYFEQSERWLNYVQRCAELAEVILIVPGASESLLMEMRMLCDEGLLDKTFVLMPPERKGKDMLQKKWQSIREDLAEIGFFLPDYQAGGMIYKPTADYSIAKGWKLHYSLTNIFFIPQMRKWNLSRQSIYDQLYP